jgi:hypothetical protein
VAVDKFGYKLPYGGIFGGVSAMTRQQFQRMNGFSNDFWGWGGEDDDISTRVTLAGYKISRYPVQIARYKMIKHMKESTNPVNTLVSFIIMSLLDYKILNALDVDTN